MKTVFIPNCRKNYDVSDAEHFGKLAVITEGIVDISNLTTLAADIVTKLKQAKEDDYLMIIGAPLVNAIAFMYLMGAFGRVNLLLFDARTRRYCARTLSEQEVMI